MQTNSRKVAAFTLIELLVVIAVIIILAGLLFPALRGAQEQARRTQAKNDLTQIVTAVNAYYTEYGKYPLVTADTVITDTSTPSSANLFYTLRAVATGSNNTANANNAANPRVIVFISPPDVKDPNNPRSGIAINSTNINNISVSPGDFVDPWGTPYNVEIDGDYTNSVANPYGAPGTGGAGSNPINQGVVARSFGSDQQPGTKISANAGDNVYKNPNPNPTPPAQSDDVISWQ
jgi:type II secretory pathway pseudopilin PulG